MINVKNVYLGVDSMKQNDTACFSLNTGLGGSALQLPEKTCDKKTKRGRCNKSAHMEVYWKDDKEVRHWSYLCRFHYYLDRIKNYIFRWRNWYCDLDD